MVTVAIALKVTTPGLLGRNIAKLGLVGSGVIVPMFVLADQLTFDKTAPGIGFPFPSTAAKISGMLSANSI